MLCVVYGVYKFQKLCILFSFSSFWIILCNLLKPVKRIYIPKLNFRQNCPWLFGILFKKVLGQQWRFLWTFVYSFMQEVQLWLKIELMITLEEKRCEVQCFKRYTPTKRTIRETFIRYTYLAAWGGAPDISYGCSFACTMTGWFHKVRTSRINVCFTIAVFIF